jgi:hypothetical protein
MSEEENNKRKYKIKRLKAELKQTKEQNMEMETKLKNLTDDYVRSKIYHTFF